MCLIWKFICYYPSMVVAKKRDSVWSVSTVLDSETKPSEDERDRHRLCYVSLPGHFLLFSGCSCLFFLPHIFKDNTRGSFGSFTECTPNGCQLFSMSSHHHGQCGTDFNEGIEKIILKRKKISSMICCCIRLFLSIPSFCWILLFFIY